MFHTEKEKRNFRRVREVVESNVPAEMVRIFDPEDNGKKVIFFGATNAEKKKIENQLERVGIKIKISSPLVPC